MHTVKFCVHKKEMKIWIYFTLYNLFLFIRAIKIGLICNLLLKSFLNMLLKQFDRLSLLDKNYIP